MAKDKRLYIRVDDELLEMLDYICEETCRSRSFIIRRLIKAAYQKGASF